MKEQLITFDTAKLAKEKGFDCRCRSKIHCSHYHLVVDNVIPKNIPTNEYEMFAPIENHNRVFLNGTQTNTSLPSQSLLHRWLREVHKIDIFITEGFHIVSKYKVYTKPSWGYFEEFDSYEGALEKGLQKALTLIK
jgi:hypothetical protein